MTDMTKTEECAKRIDNKLDDLVFKQYGETGEFERLKGGVCCCCDRFILAEKEKLFIDHDRLFAARDSTLKYNGDNLTAMSFRYLHDYYSYLGPMSKDWMKGSYLISPRSCSRKIRRQSSTSSRRRELVDEFMICPSCKDAVCKKKVAIRGIGNFGIGGLPEEFKDVTDVEFAFISPLRITAHFLLYQGGRSKKIKGFHSLVKTDIQKISNTLPLIQALHTTDHIKVVMAGHFTTKQREKVRTRCAINITRVKRMLKWFRLHNRNYSSLTDIDIDSLPVPVVEVIDANSVDDDSENENVELTEDFRVVFPDGVMDERTGGFETAEEFVSLLDRVRKAGVEAELVSKTLLESVYDDKNNNITKAFPKCFPIGVGGPQDRRLNKGGKVATIDIQDYLEHLSYTSNKVFHEPTICLVMFNMYAKQSLLRTACYRSRDDVKLTKQLSDVKMDELLRAADAKTHGLSSEHRHAMHLLKVVDAVGKNLPHTDKAAEKARGDINAIAASMGMMSVFLTVTPDEENGIEIQAYSGQDIDIFNFKINRS